MRLEQVTAGQTVSELPDYSDDTRKSFSDDVWYTQGSTLWLPPAGGKCHCAGWNSELQECNLGGDDDISPIFLQISQLQGTHYVCHTSQYDCTDWKAWTGKSAYSEQGSLFSGWQIPKQGCYFLWIAKGQSVWRGGALWTCKESGTKPPKNTDRVYSKGDGIPLLWQAGIRWGAWCRHWPHDRRW